MRLTSWNVNGIRAVVRKDLFEPFVAEIDADVICLQETKADESQVSLELAGYHQHWSSAEKKGYAGTAIFSRVAPIEVTTGLPDALITRYKLRGDPFGDPCAEGRVLTAEFADLFVVTVYTPNTKDDLGRLPLRHDKWDPAFLEYVQTLQASKPVVMCGDLNVAHTPDDLANPKSNKGKKGFTEEEREGFQHYLDAGLVDSFRLFHEGNGHYSWWSNFSKARERNVGWRIDYFLVSDSLVPRVVSADIHDSIYGSDHCPISVTLKD